MHRPAHPLKILGISGSLRKDSYNTSALLAARELLPHGVTLEIADLRDIPLYDQDAEDNMPASVSKFKSQVRAADAILIATPEYNHSFPGVLKNVIDWASRPYGDNSWDEKPVAVIGASMGRLGTARAQHHLRQVFASLNVHPVNTPEVLIGEAADRFDAEGHLTDEVAKHLLDALLQKLIRWTRQLEDGKPEPAYAGVE